MNALHLAAEHLDGEAIQRLLADGADPNVREPELGGFTALHVAVDSECEDSCYRYDMGDLEAAPLVIVSGLLLRAGANPDIPDDSGLTARRLAEERLHHDVLRVINTSV